MIRPFLVVRTSVCVVMWVKDAPRCSTLISCIAVLVHVEPMLLGVVKTTQLHQNRRPSTQQLFNVKDTYSS